MFENPNRSNLLAMKSFYLSLRNGYLQVSIYFEKQYKFLVHGKSNILRTPMQTTLKNAGFNGWVKQGQTIDRKKSWTKHPPLTSSVVHFSDMAADISRR